jgi:hypothetical protein
MTTFYGATPSTTERTPLLKPANDKAPSTNVGSATVAILAGLAICVCAYATATHTTSTSGGGGVTRLGSDPSSPLGLMTDYKGSYPIKDYNCASPAEGEPACFGDDSRLTPELLVDLVWKGLQYNVATVPRVALTVFRFSGLHTKLSGDAGGASIGKLYWKGDVKGALQALFKLLTGNKISFAKADDWLAEAFPEVNPGVKISPAGSAGAAGSDYKHNDELLAFTNLMLAYTTAVYHFEEGSVEHDGSFTAMPSPEARLGTVLTYKLCFETTITKPPAFYR